ncbi:T9SS type A sorting domain-containing protein [candidate division KSB1 bacterium]|nr:T9SS type A sorting domain-containing protein [candidate division KSB1 bacterium]
MRHGKWILFLVILPIIASAQIVINNFDGAIAEGTINWIHIESTDHEQIITDDSTDAYEGAAALREYLYFVSLNSWGTFSHMGYNTPADQPFDWSESESLSVWIKVHIAPDHPEAFILRVHLIDKPDGAAAKEEYFYENATIVDTEGSWVELSIPLLERATDGNTPPSDEGFILIPEGWGTFPHNNYTLDLDRIIAYSFSLQTTSIEQDEVEISFDNFTRSGTPNAIREEIAEIKGFELSANYPNPFNPTTEISFNLPENGNVRLSVFNLMGQEVSTLVDGFMNAGLHHAQFHANELPAGVYFYRLETASFISTRKMILLP